MSGQTHFEFFFDISSPWTYLAFARVEDMAARCRVEIDWKPVLVGGVFNAVNETVYEARANPHPAARLLRSRSASPVHGPRRSAPTEDEPAWTCHS
ncbi:MAG: hypothetical protein EBT71_02910, partial [Alphaproteobacteria bacterium]|nr:hypothetical protein [Alphaproteobacteria bacterium]